MEPFTNQGEESGLFIVTVHTNVQDGKSRSFIIKNLQAAWGQPFAENLPEITCLKLGLRLCWGLVNFEGPRCKSLSCLEKY